MTLYINISNIHCITNILSILEAIPNRDTCFNTLNSGYSYNLVNSNPNVAIVKNITRKRVIADTIYDISKVSLIFLLLIVSLGIIVSRNIGVKLKA